jgi:hypothetical protein
VARPVAGSVQLRRFVLLMCYTFKRLCCCAADVHFVFVVVLVVVIAVVL